jgi:hypothetical protein
LLNDRRSKAEHTTLANKANNAKHNNQPIKEIRQMAAQASPTRRKLLQNENPSDTQTFKTQQ